MRKSVLFILSTMLFNSPVYAEKSDLTKIEDYLNNIKTLKAGFVQMASNGSTAEGRLYISKPSKIRMEYTQPDPLLIVGNGDYVIYQDKALDQITNIDYKDIPATMILTQAIKLDGKNLKVTDLYKDSGQTSVTVEMPKNPNVKPITLVFDNSPFQLKQWKVIDPQNIEVTISLFDLEKDTDIAANMFKFDKSADKSFSKTKRK